MKKIPLLLMGLGLAGICASAVSARAQDARQWFTSDFEHVLGTSLELKFEAGSAADASAAEKAALAEIDRLDAILSGYSASSEFSRWVATRGVPVRVSPELFEVLALFDAWRERTSGALDASAETAGRLWQSAAKTQQMPSAADLERVVNAMQQTHWRLDRAQGTATHLTDAPLRLNSFAKSYIIERACQAALGTGRVSSAVVNIGGDIVIRGRSAETVALTDPTAAAENDEPIANFKLRDRAVATSGDYRRGVMIAGQWYSHLIDPRTGRPTDQVRSATVISPSATDAGALATALCVMEAKDGTRLAQSSPDTEYMLVLANGSQISSPGWSSVVGEGNARSAQVHGAVAASPSPAPVAVTGGGGFEVLVNLEVAVVGGGRSRRPFVAVWVEDKDNHPIRTVALWYKGARWLPDLRQWMRARNAEDNAPNPASIASATRGPGRYSLRWDGRDDLGSPVPPGEYTIKIEAAREHGTHQLITGKINTSKPGAHVDLPGNVELAGASLELVPGSSR